MLGKIAAGPDVQALALPTSLLILCFAGCGPLDETASAMLAQLLEKQGFQTRAVAHEAASRQRIRSMDVTDVALVCVSYLDISGSPSNLRYLVQRLRLKITKVPIFVGIWPAQDRVLNDERIQATIRVDHYFTALREAVNACLPESANAAAVQLKSSN